jgi:hypothetical protein
VYWTEFGSNSVKWQKQLTYGTHLWPRGCSEMQHNDTVELNNIILTVLGYNTRNLEVSDFLYNNEKYSANLLCIYEFTFLPYNSK